MSVSGFLINLLLIFFLTPWACRLAREYYSRALRARNLAASSCVVVLMCIVGSCLHWNFNTTSRSGVFHLHALHFSLLHMFPLTFITNPEYLTSFTQANISLLTEAPHLGSSLLTTLCSVYISDFALHIHPPAWVSELRTDYLFSTITALFIALILVFLMPPLAHHPLLFSRYSCASYN